MRITGITNGITHGIMSNMVIDRNTGISSDYGCYANNFQGGLNG